MDAEYQVEGNKSENTAKVEVNPGDYVVVEIENTTGITLLGRPIARTTLSRFSEVSSRH